MNMHADPQDMHPGLVEIHLHGPLAEEFGTPHRFDIQTPIEAVAAMDANHPGFVQKFAKHEHYCIYADGDWRDGADAARLPISRELHFCPIIEGRAFIGAALVGALFPAIAGTAAATIIGGVLFAGLLMGISFLLTPKVEAGDGPAEKDENYAFSGPANITAQGAAVPLVYGRVHCGSVVVSAGLELNTEYVVSTKTQAATQGVNGRDAGGVRAGDEPSIDVTPADLPPPPDGWPPIIEGDFGWQPEGWQFAARQRVDQEGTSKEINIWILDPETLGTTDMIYSWTEVRGFYAYEAATAQEDDQWRESETIEPPPPEIDSEDAAVIQTMITSPTDGATVEPLTPVTGTTAPEREVHLLVQDIDSAQTEADGEGNFIFAGDTPLGDPGETVTIQAIVEETTDSPIVTVTIVEEGGYLYDTVITSPLDGATVDAHAPIIGTSAPGAIVRLLTQGTEHAQITADGDGNFIFSGAAALGAPGTLVIVQAIADDTNDSAVITVTIAEETLPADTFINSPGDGAIVDAVVPILGTTALDAVVHLLVNGVDVAQTNADTEGNFTFDGPEPLGNPGDVVTLQATAEGSNDSPIITVTIAGEAQTS